MTIDPRAVGGYEGDEPERPHEEPKLFINRKPVGPITPHITERSLWFLALVMDWGAPFVAAMMFGRLSGIMLLIFWGGNNAIYQGMTGGQSIGKQVLGLRPCYVSIKYWESAAYWCELTMTRSCVRFVLHFFDLLVLPYAILRVLLRYDRRSFADSFCQTTVIRDRRIIPCTAEEMHADGELKKPRY